MNKRMLFPLLILVTACGIQAPGYPTATPMSPPHPLTVAISPSLRPVKEALRVCAEETSSVALSVEEIPSDSMEQKEADLNIRLGPPEQDNTFTVPLAVEQIVVIIHPAVQKRRIDRETLAHLYSRETRNWDTMGPGSDGQPSLVNLWDYPPGNELHRIFSKAIFGEVKPPVAEARLAPDPSAMLEAVANQTGSIGYIPHAWVDERITTSNVGSTLNHDLKLPLIAFAFGQPNEVERDFLICLQSGNGQRALMNRYQPWQVR